MTDRERFADALRSMPGEPLGCVLDRVAKVGEEVRAEEREACAQVCDSGMRDECSPTYLAASIRARGDR